MGRHLLIIGGYREHGGGGIGTFVLELEEQLSDEYDISKYNQTATPIDSFIISVLVILLKLMRFPLTTQPDVVHINTTSDLGFYRDSVYILFISFIWKTPIALRTGGSGFDEFITTDSSVKQWYLRLIFSRVDVLFPLTELQADALATYTNEEKMTILRQVTAVSNYSPVWDNEKIGILFLSSLSDRKGFREFAQAIEDILSDSDIDTSRLTVDIAGDGKHEQLAESLAAEFDAVTYHGYVSGQAKFDLFNHTSIFVLPTHAEGFPNAIIEAMAGGNAIISTDVSGIPGVINEENGLIIEPENEEQLREALRTLISDKTLTTQMGRTNHKTAKKNYTWDHAKTQLLNVYEDVLIPT